MTAIQHIYKKVIQIPESVVKIVFSSPIQDTGKAKVNIRPTLVRGKLVFQVTTYFSTNCIVKNISSEKIIEFLKELIGQYRDVYFSFIDEEYYIHGEGKIRKKLKVAATAPDLSHNKQKEYAIPEGKPIPFLIELGIMKNDGAVHPSKRDKFIQINTFLKLIAEVIPKKKSLNIVDFGCGKAYLTFALYHYLSRDHTITMQGFDLKSDLMHSCSELAKKLGFNGLTFSTRAIQDVPIDESVDIACALHACNTATDWAIYQALRMQAQVIAVAPCCHHEVATQIAKDALPVVLKHGILKERFSALLTDAIRARALEDMGYSVEVVEFVDAEHTPQNIMIRAVKRRGVFTTKNDDLQKICKTFGISPSLVKLTA